MEVGTHSPWVSALADALGHKVTVVNPHAFKLITGSRKKSDKDDAEMLARAARADLELVQPIAHRKEATRIELSLLRTRDHLVRSRTGMVNTVRGMLKSFGLRVPACTTEVFHVRAREIVPDELKPAVDPLLAVLEQLSINLRALETRITKKADEHPEIAMLTSIPRVGKLTALAFVLVVEDAKRFKDSRAVGAYLGLTPGRRQSGDRDAPMGITKQGDALLRKLLVQCAHQLMFKSAPDSALKRWGLAKSQTSGKHGKKKVAVALARKLAVVMHRLMLTGELYDPFPNAQANGK
jgi:transposase